ncbi:MAG TPA: thiamine phosphate synthase, partial [Candidatus Polarisedimenticolaceae bacterium]|nr:thiamine phosphate synthase [Candidatus Polarisedimenticolaceae bacterium]
MWPDPAPPRLMLVTDRQRTRGRALVPLVAAAVQGGVGLIQVREKDLPTAELSALVEAICQVAGSHATVLVNRDAVVARRFGCGLHLPAGDPLPALPAGLPFGRSAHDEQEAAAAVAEGARYLVVGTVFPSAGKPGRPGIGLG